jgi:hypothetical protein
VRFSVRSIRVDLSAARIRLRLVSADRC